MKKINFENYPSTNSPINGTNLNLLQDNIEDDIGLLNDLNTTDKSNLVNAVNEINDITKGILLWQNQNQSSNFNSHNSYFLSSNYRIGIPRKLLLATFQYACSY